MPFNIKKTASITQPEILRFPTGLQAIKSVVIDATDFVVPADGSRYQVMAGTALQLSATNTNQYVKFKGSGAVGTVKGILASTIDLAAQATAADEPAAMFFHECVFATEAIVDFTLYSSALINDLKTCLFQ